jgi:hypothetical protein
MEDGSPMALIRKIDQREPEDNAIDHQCIEGDCDMNPVQ